MAITRTQIQTNISNAITFLEQMSSETITDFKTMETAFLAAATGKRFAGTLGVQKNLRSSLAALYNPVSILPSFIRSQLLEWGETIGVPTTLSDQDLLDFIIEDMIDNSLSVNSREIVFGTPAASGGNVGDGVLLVLNENQYGDPIESGFVEAKQAVVTFDQTSSRVRGRHNEIIEFRGQPRSLENLELSEGLKSGLRLEAVVLSETGGILRNPSFSDFVKPSATLTSLPGWTTTGGDLTNLNVDTANYFRANIDIANPASLEFSAPEGIYQSLQNFSINRRTPYLLTFVYNREVGLAPAGTTIKVTWGDESHTFPALAGTETGWNRLTVPLDLNLYPRQWVGDEPQVKLEVTVLASGTLLIDEILFFQMYNVDASYYAPIGGATPFQVDDEFTWTNSFTGTDSIIQKWFAMAYRRHLPAVTGGGETWVDPTIP